MQDQLAASVVTTFPSYAWNTYAKRMLESMAQYWPKEIALLVVLDDDTLLPDVTKIIRPQDACVVFASKEREEFLKRNAGKDDPQDYRKQASRFCHKVFALKFAADYWKASTDPQKARYVIWLDADVIISRLVTVDEVTRCLPVQGDEASYLGREDWDHSECGWLAFDLENGGNDVINRVHNYYITDKVFQLDQWHDSFVWDKVRGEIALEAINNAQDFKQNMRGWTNLTFRKKGMDIWPQSPMAAWSRHYKGPEAKKELTGEPRKKEMKQVPIQIQTINSRPNKELQDNIAINQMQIKNWIGDCLPSDEEIVVVSAGPMMIPEDLQAEVDAGRKIVAVKHALQPLKEAGIKPWACILLDPREHVYDFVDNPDTDIIWFVASQVTPKAVTKLLDAGCNVWGYHADVGAEEGHLTAKQPRACVAGGSATATRGLFLLYKLGFSKFRLYGYDLSYPDKLDLDAKDERGQPANFEISLEAAMPHYKKKAAFWTKAELIAQYNEINQIINDRRFVIQAFGTGIVPFISNAKRVSDLRTAREKNKLDGLWKIGSLEELLGQKGDKWKIKTNKNRFWAGLLKGLRKTPRKPMPGSSF